MLEQIQPLYDKLVVKRIKIDKTSSGLYLPDDGAGATLVKGEVVAIGGGKLAFDGSIVPLIVKVGDVVSFNRNNEIEAEEDYALLREESLIGIVIDNETDKINNNIEITSTLIKIVKDNFQQE
jgi:co-chaperonin GroES (HSP10)